MWLPRPSMSRLGRRFLRLGDGDGRAITIGIGVGKGMVAFSFMTGRLAWVRWWWWWWWLRWRRGRGRGSVALRFGDGDVDGCLWRTCIWRLRRQRWRSMHGVAVRLGDCRDVLSASEPGRVDGGMVFGNRGRAWNPLRDSGRIHGSDSRVLRGLGRMGWMGWMGLLGLVRVMIRFGFGRLRGLSMGGRTRWGWLGIRRSSRRWFRRRRNRAWLSSRPVVVPIPRLIAGHCSPGQACHEDSKEPVHDGIECGSY